jgi:hypothetical protein
MVIPINKTFSQANRCAGPIPSALMSTGKGIENSALASIGITGKSDKVRFGSYISVHR